MSKISSNVKPALNRAKPRTIVPEFVGSSNTLESKKFGSEIGASHYSPDFSKQIVKPVSEWKFSFGKHKDVQLQDANPVQLRPWCRWLVKKVGNERPISSAYAQAYLDGKTHPIVCDWSKNEQPFLTIGRYRGFPLNLIQDENPTYFQWLLSNDTMSKNISDSMKEYIEKNFLSK